jgi:hypothetical protein
LAANGHRPSRLRSKLNDAGGLAGRGALISRMSSVMAMAKTPSLSASTRVVSRATVDA